MFSPKKRDSNPIYALLKKPLFSWPGHSSDQWRIGDAVAGVQIFGATGSGKTSGSGRKIAKAFLKNGFGGLVLCAKPGERASWEAYAKETGRSGDLVTFDPGDKQFNPIYYEQHRFGKGKGETLNITNLIMILHDLGRGFMAGGAGGGDNERFWDHAVRRAISRMIDLLKLSEHDLTIMNMREIMVNAFTPSEADRWKAITKVLDDPKSGEEDRKIVVDDLKRWGSENYCLACLLDIRVREIKKELSESEKETSRLVRNYFFKEFAYLADRTRSIILESFLGLIQPFESGILKEQFSTGISDDLWPELASEEGKIIILDFPIKEHLISGIYGQGIYKFIFQQAMERRNVETEDDPRPCFLWVDESHFFVNPEYDNLFQSTARSSMVCTVYLSQNINSYYAAMGNKNPAARTKSLMGNLATKIFHANGDFDTNSFASGMIGQDFREMASLQRQNITPGMATLSEQLFPKVFPHEFASLEQGGRAENGFKTEAIIFKSPGQWSTKETYIRVKFDQNE